MIVVIEEVDDRRGRAVHRREQRRAEPGGAADDEIDRPRPLLLEDFPAAVGIAEAALEGPRPGHGRLARDAADAEDLDVEPLAHRGRPRRARLGVWQ